ncbi:hypothetical protein PAXINDRAFT_19956 [Paxillus involutus ATCC 200175]|uniref:Uncharacterized protein n=1 Tax=Paxillus involutus ATCC 200175 TaxID=664439 RepID=A0A0C9SMV7_PAXIN|nr:hypothetical protein PAXINDRAFT_19956 [Paxillus involutus ATCC 200175]
MLEADDQCLDAKAPFHGDSFVVSQVHQRSTLAPSCWIPPQALVVADAVYPCLPQAATVHPPPELGNKPSSGDGQPNDYFVKKFFRLVGIVIAQFLILIFASSWLAVEINEQCISFDSFLTRMIVARPSISTTVVTLMATALSLASTGLFCLSIKEAMRHFLWKPRQLIQLSAGVALVKGNHIFRLEYMTLTLTSGKHSYRECSQKRRKAQIFGVSRHSHFVFNNLSGPAFVYNSPESETIPHSKILFRITEKIRYFG